LFLRTEHFYLPRIIGARAGAGERIMKNSNDEKGRAMVEPDFDPISAALKQLHHSVASEPLPDNFLRILDEIDAKIAARQANQ
jgi:hypothetical protein